MNTAGTRNLGAALALLVGVGGWARVAAAESVADPLAATREAARTALREGRPEEARAGFQEVLATAPADPEARFNLAGLALDQGDSDGALAHYQTLLDHPVEGSEARYNIALVLTDQGRLADAAREMRQVVEHRPDYAAARLRLGQLLERLEDRVGAAAQYREAAEIVPEDPAPLAGLARLAVDQSQPDQALELYTRAAALDPLEPSYPERAGDLEAARDRRGPARIHWVAAEQILKGRDGLDDQISRARLAHKLGRQGDARALLRKVLARAPDHPGALELAPDVLGEQAAGAARAQGRAHVGLFETGRGGP
jgi:tetratricopeptide (TPR) repeat protein